MSVFDGVWQALAGAAMWLAGALGAAPSVPGFYQGYVEGEYVRVGLPAAGTLQTLAVARGRQVAAGDLLFTLDDTAERAARDEAVGRLRQAEAQLEDLKKGRRPTELDAIAAQRNQAEASLRLSESELRRSEQLLAAKVAAQSRVDEARSAYRRDQARVAELTAQLATARLAAREDAIAMAAASVATAKSTLEQAEWRLSQRAAAAPAAALVADTLYVEGEFVPAGSPVVSLLPAGNVKIRFFVPEPQLGAIQVGQKLGLSCDGCAPDLEAAVSFIAPQAEFTPPVIYSQTTRAKLVFLVEARPVTGAERLHPGQPVELRVGR